MVGSRYSQSGSLKQVVITFPECSLEKLFVGLNCTAREAKFVTLIDHGELFNNMVMEAIETDQ